MTASREALAQAEREAEEFMVEFKKLHPGQSVLTYSMTRMGYIAGNLDGQIKAANAIADPTARDTEKLYPLCTTG